MLKLGSLFDGSGAFPLAGMIAGIEPKWNSEIEPFPIRVTEKRFPNVKHYGDISTVDGKKIEPVDIITFGSPCQDVSLAGKRKGMKHSLNGDEENTRSGLFFDALRIIDEMRTSTQKNGTPKPRYAIYENVAGVYSSNDGDDFCRVLEEFCQIKDINVTIPKLSQWPNAGEIKGKDFSIAWRTFDAQYWGVPQRRKRIYLVADFDGHNAGKIVFASEGLNGFTKKERKIWTDLIWDAEYETAEDVVGAFKESVSHSG